MRLSAPTSVVLVSAWFVLAVATTLEAQLDQAEIRTLSADALCRVSLNVGDSVMVTGKYKELIDEDLYLFDCGLPLRLEKQRHFGQILNFTPKQDNLTVIGVVGLVRGERVVHVRELNRAPGDFVIFRREYLALKKTDPRQHAEQLTRLGRRILRASKRQKNRRLLHLAREAFKDALELDPNGERESIPERIERIKAVHQLLQDDAFARDLVLPILAKDPANESALEFLGELGCRKYKNRWLTHSEFKRLEGLVLSNGKWVTPRVLHHQRALDQFADLPKANLPLLRRRTEREYILVAEEGRVEPGMRREEVCLALGFPDFVLRRGYKRKEFDQWSYGKKYYYFYDGTLVFVPRQR